ncbi:MAG TPA: hypothetical protein VM282_10850 [Acidimicrobiales bacterium]|nr:hypothetical protein [Acidimicrobiales bacterium]
MNHMTIQRLVRRYEISDSFAVSSGQILDEQRLVDDRLVEQ